MLCTPALDAARLLDRLESRLHAALVLRDEITDLLLLAVLARGHVLFEDEPGMGKTLLARALAAALGGAFTRIQFTPDLLPADIVGGSVYSPRTGDFDFRPGPVFQRGARRRDQPGDAAHPVGAARGDGGGHVPEAELDRFVMRLLRAVRRGGSPSSPRAF